MSECITPKNEYHKKNIKFNISQQQQKKEPKKIKTFIRKCLRQYYLEFNIKKVIFAMIYIHIRIYVLNK